MPERQQISHRLCNIYQCRQITARNVTESVDILCQQTGNRNRANPANRTWRQISGRNRAGSARHNL